MSISNVRQKIIISVIFGLLIYLILAIYADLSSIAKVFGSFNWFLLIPALFLTLWNYLLRFVKWQYYLDIIGAGNISKWQSFLAFFSGLSMVVTPGKIGEWLKCFLVKEVNRTPVSKSAPIIVAERLTDGIAMLLLASFGLVLYSYGWQVLLIICCVTLLFLAVIQWRSLCLKILYYLGKISFLSKRIDYFHHFYESSYLLFNIKNLIIAIILGVFSWFGECLALFFILIGLGISPSFELLVQATFILAASTIIASVAFVPGGLGVAEGSITGMLLVLSVTKEPAIAAAATVIIRFCTLWFGVAIGLIALSIFSKNMSCKVSEIVVEKLNSPSVISEDN